MSALVREKQRRSCSAFWVRIERSEVLEDKLVVLVVFEHARIQREVHDEAAAYEAVA